MLEVLKVLAVLPISPLAFFSFFFLPGEIIAVAVVTPSNRSRILRGKMYLQLNCFLVQSYEVSSFEGRNLG